MFDNFEFEINGRSVSGITAFIFMILPVLAFILLGVMIGAML